MKEKDGKEWKKLDKAWIEEWKKSKFWNQERGLNSENKWNIMKEKIMKEMQEQYERNLARKINLGWTGI